MLQLHEIQNLIDSVMIVFPYVEVLDDRGKKDRKLSITIGQIRKFIGLDNSNCCYLTLDDDTRYLITLSVEEATSKVNTIKSNELNKFRRTY